MSSERSVVAGATKVPAITGLFWVAKILTTAMGEATSDYFVNRYNPEVVVVIGFVAFAAALALQFRTPRYVAWVYWLAALMVSVFGTMAADVAHVGLGIPYVVSTVLCAIGLAVVFVMWNRTEGTLSIHSITTPRREAFYWATALVTFALGTATGDLTAITFHLGFLSSGILFVVVFAVPAVAYWRFRINPILAFWAAYVVTRPLGASFADWAAKPRSAGGLDRGDGLVSLVLGIGIVAVVGYLSVGRTDAIGPLEADTAVEPA